MQDAGRPLLDISMNCVRITVVESLLIAHPEKAKGCRDTGFASLQ